MQVAPVAGVVGRRQLRPVQRAGRRTQHEAVVQAIDGAGPAAVGQQQVGDDLHVGKDVLQDADLEGGVLDVGPPGRLQTIFGPRGMKQVGLAGGQQGVVLLAVEAGRLDLDEFQRPAALDQDIGAGHLAAADEGGLEERGRIGGQGGHGVPGGRFHVIAIAHPTPVGEQRAGQGFDKVAARGQRPQVLIAILARRIAKLTVVEFGRAGAGNVEVGLGEVMDRHGQSLRGPVLRPRGRPPGYAAAGPPQRRWPAARRPPWPGQCFPGGRGRAA